MSGNNKIFCGTIGTGYCGSTMLSYILGGSVDIFSTGELTKGFPRYRCAKSWHRGDWTTGGECSFWTEDFSRDLAVSSKSLRNKKLKKHAYNVFGKRVVFNVDKDPKWYESSIANGDDLDAVIILFKRPQAFAFSYEAHKRNRTSLGRDALISSACESYVKTYRRAMRVVLENKIPHIYVQYEDLAARPYREVKRICKFLNAEYSDSLINYWDNKQELHMSPSGNRGAHRQFLGEDAFKETWNKHLDPNFNDKAYHAEHAEWFLENYHKITLDEKWKRYFSKEDIKRIRKKHRDTLEIFNKMVEKK
jgi:hypothetical protein